MKNKLLILIIALLGLTACEKYLDTDTSDWSEDSHGIHTPDYNLMFNTDFVHRIDVNVEAGYWNTLMKNVERLQLSISTTPNMEEEKELIIPALPSLDYVPSQISYNGQVWNEVGFRFKGLSSQKQSWENGILKMPVKLDFNKFGNIYKDIENQRFYGFEKMTFANNFRDPSQVREKVAYELMEAFGIRVPKTNFAEIYVDNGIDGQRYFGLYTMVETVEDGMIHAEFGDDTGNCYKPAGRSSTLTKGEVNRFDLNQKTNKGSAIDDVLSFVEVLHDDSRNTSVLEWHIKMESVFEVDVFLRFLAANTIIQNWDTYGLASHNFYLYTQPSNGRIIFIPWDLSESFDLGGKIASHNLDQSNVTESWPLINFLMEDEHYYKLYKGYVKDFNENIFVPSQIHKRIDELYDLISDSVSKEETGYTHHESIEEVENYKEELKIQITNRHEEVKSFY